MKPSSIKSKGRRLQTELAERLSVAFDLTIDAEPPTKAGTRENGAVYVPEGYGDIRVRRMGQPGADVLLCSKTAQELVTLDGKPVYWECKNTEGFDPMTIIRKAEIPAWLDKAFLQCSEAIEKQPVGYTPVIVLRSNRVKPLVLWKHSSISIKPLELNFIMKLNSLLVTGLEEFITILGSTPVFASTAASTQKTV